MVSLVLSTLLFNAHVRVLTGRELSILNAVYMRVLRRITDKVRFDSDTISDYRVRCLACQPSIDCLLQRARLKYLGRLSRSSNKPLLAILSARGNDGGIFLSCVRQIQRDLQELHKSVPDVRRDLPDPMTNPDEWRELM